MKKEKKQARSKQQNATKKINNEMKSYIKSILDEEN